MHHGLKTIRTCYLSKTNVTYLRAISSLCKSKLRTLNFHETQTWPKALSTYPARHAKRKSILKVTNLAQGMLPELSLVEKAVDEGPSYPTVIQQARNNMRKFENCVLLTRVGGFYELYFEHAEEYGPLLNLRVAQKKTTAGSVSMVIPAYICSFCFLRLCRQDFRSFNSTDS